MPSSDRKLLEAEFPEVARMLRSGLPDVPREKPDERLWQNIVGEVRADVSRPLAPALDLTGREQALADEEPLEHKRSLSSDPLGGHQHSVDQVYHSTEKEPGSGQQVPVVSTSETAGVPDLDTADVTDLDAARATRRAPRWAGLVAAAAAIALAVPAALIVMGRASAPGASAELVALATQSGDGAAELRDRTLRVDITTSTAPEGSFYEVWLLAIDDSEELEDLRSLGRIESGADFVVPDGLDLDRFDVVDVSVELDDGDPAHSGDSVLRGVLG